MRERCLHPVFLWKDFLSGRKLNEWTKEFCGIIFCNKYRAARKGEKRVKIGRAHV